jgi:hypothetical protein
VSFTEDPFEAVFDPDALHPEFTNGGTNGGPNHRIKARCVAAAGKDAYLLIHTKKSAEAKNIILLQQLVLSK